MKKRISSACPVVADNKGLPLLITAVIVAVLINVIFFLTYPINVGQSDNPTYLSMIIFGNSDLMQASGYPATVHLLAHRLLPILPPVNLPHMLPSDIGPGWYYRLQTLQLLLHLALFFISIFLCAKIFSKSASAILTLGWGCNILFISNVDATAPEWLQADTLILSVLLHAYSRKLRAKKKVLVYCLAAGVFALASLIKPNSLIFAICLVAFLLFDNESWRFKALQLAGSVAIFVFVTSAYARTYHYKSTGTTQLNFDHAWVMTASLPDGYVSASPEALGLNSLRWAVLVRVTPPDYFRAGAVNNIRYGPPADLGRQFAGQLDRISHMSREELLQFVRARPLPPTYSQWASAVPLYYYYGLEKTDALGSDVYFESLQSHPWFYIKKIADSLKTFLLYGLKGIQTFPTFADPIGLKFLPPDFNASFFGKSRLVPPPDNTRYFLQYYNPVEMVSFYGVKLIQWINAVTAASILYIALDLIALPGFFRLKPDFKRITAFSLLVALLAFISASGMLLGLRQKELIAITPLYFLLLSIGLVSGGKWWVETVTRFQKGNAVKRDWNNKRHKQHI